MVEITLLYASLIGILFLILSVRVILGRRAVRVAWGDGGDKELKRRIRGQANCAEYAPIGLLLLTLLELNGAPGWELHLIGVVLVAGRALHGWAFSFADAPMLARVGG
ncbi:MAG: MAPEG family protein, partial [Pseudomonadota bacterium]